MSSELVVITPKSIEEAERLSGTLSKSQLLPDALRQKPADVLATVLAGAELGLAPMQAIRGIAIIKGKPTLSADTMGALVKRRQDVCEYLVLKESTPKVATYETKRRGDPSPTTMSFAIEDAQRAGLQGDNWKKYPAAMLRARALSAICRAVYPDLCLGLYDPDELAPENPPPPNGPVERDVTPAAPPTKTEQVKAKLAATLGVVDAEVVKLPSPWERIKAMGSEKAMDTRACGVVIKELTGKTKTATLTEEDVGAFAKWLEEQEPPAGEPPPEALEAVPF
jgi:hypothetical protein